MESQVDGHKVSFEDAPFSSVHRKVTAGAFMGQISDGYTLGIVGISLSYAAGPLGLTSFWMGLIGAGSMFGILFGGLLTGILADRIGRCLLFRTVMLLAVALSVLQFFISDPLVLTCMRFLLGVVIGADYTVGISLLSEWTPKRRRSNLLAWLLVLWTFGYSIAYIIGFFMDDLGDNSWRWVLCTSAIPGVIALLLRQGTPESPKWLTAKGRKEEALAVIHRCLGKDYGLPREDPQAASASWFMLFSPAQWRSTIVSGVFFAAQVLPFFAISIFLPLVLEKLNMTNPHASGVLYNIFTIIGVLVGTWLYSVISRRSFLLWTFYLAAAILASMIIWKHMPSMVALTMVTLFSLVLAIAIVAEFSYPPELFPTELRASGVGLTVAISRIGAGGGTFLLPIISEQFGIYAALWACVGTLLLGGVICQMWAPETSGRGKRAALQPA